VPGSCLAGIAQLKHLTLLELKGRWQDDEEEQPLQLLAQALPLRELYIDYGMRHGCKMDLAQLTQLQLLHSNVELCEGSVLPEQLQDLKLRGAFYGQGLAANAFPAVLRLQQLQRLEFEVGFQNPLLLKQLAALPALQHLALVYESPTQAVATASVWGQLPQLRELWLHLSDIRPAWQPDMVSVAQVEALAAGAAAAAGLTTLVLSVAMRDEEVVAAAASDGQHGGAVPGAAVCAGLARLASLRVLEICGPRLVPGDALALTALTSLKHLDIRNVGAGVDSAVATALARSLRQLRFLALPLAACADDCDEFDAAIAELTSSWQLHQTNVGGWQSCADMARCWSDLR
jgi:hypothetical protein